MICTNLFVIIKSLYSPNQVKLCENLTITCKNKNIGFGSDYNQVTIISNDGSEEEIDSSRKVDVAYKILKNIHKNYFITKKSLRNNA